MVEALMPKDLASALDLLEKNECVLFAGGTDLMVQKRSWSETIPKFDKPVMFLSGIKQLGHIIDHPNHISIGAMVTLENLLVSDLTPKLLKRCIAEMAAPGIRNLATLAGNIGNASPAGDSLPVLYVLDAMVKIQSKSDSRLVNIADYIIGPRQTILAPNEMITEIQIPKRYFTNESFVKVGPRRSDTIAKLSLAGVASIENAVVTEIRIAFGAVYKTIVRDKLIEASLSGKSPSALRELVPEIIDKYSKLIVPIDDQRSSAQYRHQVSLNLLADFIRSL